MAVSPREELDAAVQKFVQQMKAEGDSRFLALNWVLGWEEVLVNEPADEDEEDLAYVIDYCASPHLSVTGVVGLSHTINERVILDTTSPYRS